MRARVGRLDAYDLALWAMALAALALRLYDLGGPSVWLDETATRREMSWSLWTVLTRVAFPPLYFLLLDLWTRLFGDGWWALRAFSAVAGSLAVVAFGRLVLALFDSRPLMVASAAVFALMPHSLQFSREARMYPLWVLWLLIASAAAIRAARAERPAKRDLVQYWLGVAAAAATHHYTVFYALALVLGTYVLTGRHWLWKERRDWRRLAVLHGPLALAVLVEIGAAVAFSGLTVRLLVAKITHDLRQTATPPPLRILSDLFFFPSWTLSQPFPAGEALIVLSVAASAALASATRCRLRSVVFLVIVGLGPLVALSALPIRSYPRLLSPSVPFLVALLVFAASLLVRQARWRWLLVPFAAVWIWMLAPRVLDVYRVEIEPWKPVCAAIARSGRQGAVLITEPYMRAPFDLCYRGPHPVRTFSRGDVRDPESMRRFVRGRRMVFVIYAHGWRSDPQRRALGIVAGEGFRLRRAKVYGRVIETYLYVRHGRRLAAAVTGQTR
jgi:4-amino-4-deoxy-L-arabinose transferase-like glycosyltransferase